MSTSLLIRGGTVVNDDFIQRADVLVRDGIIVQVEPSITGLSDDVQVIDATGRLVIPGGIDPHTHLEFPMMPGVVTADDYFHGTRAAIAGGTTMVIDFCVPQKQQDLLTAYQEWRGRADPKVCCDYGLSVAITSWSEKIRDQMRDLASEKYGINSFKFYMAYAGLFMVTDDEMYNAMKVCSEIGALARVHAENGEVIANREREMLEAGVTGPEGHHQSRPETLSDEATYRACTLAGEAHCPVYIVHVNTKGSAHAIAEHRKRGTTVFGEPIAAGLALDGSHYYDKDWLHAARYVCSPPLSVDSSTSDTLVTLLASGLLNLTATDNCTFNCHHREMGRHDFTKIPNGINGLEDRLSIVWDRGVASGKMDAMRFVAVTSSTAAKIFNIYPKKGRIAVGSDADIVIWNPDATRTVSSATHNHGCDYNIFEGMSFKGVAETTIVHGKVAWRNGKLSVEKGWGKFVPLLPFSPAVFGAVDARRNAARPVRVDRPSVVIAMHQG